MFKLRGADEPPSCFLAYRNWERDLSLADPKLPLRPAGTVERAKASQSVSQWWSCSDCSGFKHWGQWYAAEWLWVVEPNGQASSVQELQGQFQWHQKHKLAGSWLQLSPLIPTFLAVLLTFAATGFGFPEGCGN